MKLQLSGQMRLEQKLKLAPRMIQSMEILQLPTLALQEKIDQELNSNPVLEMADPSPEEMSQTESAESSLSVEDRGDEDFQRLEGLGDEFKDYFEQDDPIRRRGADDQTDYKLEAIKNTAAPAKSLHEHLMEQWGLVDADHAVRKAGENIIDNINDRGYIAVPLEQLLEGEDSGFSMEDLAKALNLVQKLEPAGVGARDLAECLLIQMAQDPEDTSFEAMLVRDYMQELLENRLPEIARKVRCGVEDINRAIERMSKLDTSPGLQVARETNHPITADVIAEPLEPGDRYIVRLTDSGLPNLQLNRYYLNMSEEGGLQKGTRKFLRDNIRSAQWLMEAIEQRKKTLLAVARSIVERQKDFFEKGPLYLKPLPMSQVASDVGVHLATVSRAVAGKYIQCPWGVLPLRKFFSGGTAGHDGEHLSWEAIRVKLQQIVDSEDKADPLNDDILCAKLTEAGVGKIARRTVAKYRKLMNIPPARLRKKY